MAIYKNNPNPNSIVCFLRKAYNPLGFKKGYNATLWFIFAGALAGFCLSRAAFLDVGGYFKANTGPGEWFYYRESFGRAAITLHLASVIPAGLLAVLQFTPVIRHKFRTFHRINGYAIMLLIMLANVSALMIARHAFGGTMAAQAWVGALALMTTVSMTLAYINIRRLQIEQHRAWMLRLWAYLGTIITVRLIMAIAAILVGRIGGYYLAVSCEQIEYAADGATSATTSYPACQVDPKGWTAVEANLFNPSGVAEAKAALQTNFGMAGWLSLTLHVVAVEIYLGLTPAEGERLRNLSYERQVERGMRMSGSAGLTADRLGDAEEWVPESSKSAEYPSVAGK